MHLTETAEDVNWPEMHYVFIEKIGPFMETAPAAWHEFLPLLPAITEQNEMAGCMALYKIEPDKMTYRAGASLADRPAKLPPGVQYELFHGGKYSRFVMTGAYSNLPQAYGRVFEIVKQAKLHVRDDFNIEHYTNNPQTTPEDQLVTEILIPTA